MKKLNEHQMAFLVLCMCTALCLRLCTLGVDSVKTPASPCTGLMKWGQKKASPFHNPFRQPKGKVWREAGEGKANKQGHVNELKVTVFKCCSFLEQRTARSETITENSSGKFLNFKGAILPTPDDKVLVVTERLLKVYKTTERLSEISVAMRAPSPCVHVRALTNVLAQ